MSEHWIDAVFWRDGQKVIATTVRATRNQPPPTLYQPCSALAPRARMIDGPAIPDALTLSVEVYECVRRCYANGHLMRADYDYRRTA